MPVLTTSKKFLNEIEKRHGVTSLFEIQEAVSVTVRDCNAPEYERIVQFSMRLPQAIEILRDLKRQVKDKASLGETAAVSLFVCAGSPIDHVSD
jgi:hypothetical protein